MDVAKAEMQVLETQGVPVVGLKTSDFPAFFTPSSGLPVPLRVWVLIFKSKYLY